MPRIWAPSLARRYRGWGDGTQTHGRRATGRRSKFQCDLCMPRQRRRRIRRVRYDFGTAEPEILGKKTCKRCSAKHPFFFDPLTLYLLGPKSFACMKLLVVGLGLICSVCSGWLG